MATSPPEPPMTPAPSKIPLRPPAAVRMEYCFMTVLPAANDAPTVPANVATPVTLANVDATELSCTRYNAPDWKARLLATVVEEPGAPLPGRKMPPLAIVVLPKVPAPVSEPLAITVVSRDEAIEPSTSRTPPNTVVVPV